MQEIIEGLQQLNVLPSKDKRSCIEDLLKIYRNVVNHPCENKYRCLKMDNSFFNNLWKQPGIRTIMKASGWIVKDNMVEFPEGLCIKDSLKIILDHRLVKPNASEWVPETKIVCNAKQDREKYLREKALAEKERDMKLLQKDMAERKIIADRIRKEHHNDIKEYRKFYTPAKANPLRVYEDVPSVSSSAIFYNCEGTTLSGNTNQNESSSSNLNKSSSEEEECSRSSEQDES